MKIAIIGPGIISIPPKGWGAVESLIWDYYIELKNKGHEVKIINTLLSNIIGKDIYCWKFLRNHKILQYFYALTAEECQFLF
jgi:hypothetical protein